MLLLGTIPMLISPDVHADDGNYRIKFMQGHPWRPPFGLDRVGQPYTAVVESTGQPQHTDYVLTILLHGKEVGRHPVTLTGKPPCSVSVAIAEYGDRVVLSAAGQDSTRRIELARQATHIPRIEFDAVARPETRDQSRRPGNDPGPARLAPARAGPGGRCWISSRFAATLTKRRRVFVFSSSRPPTARPRRRLTCGRTRNIG